jgi:hypothetical protein
MSKARFIVLGCVKEKLPHRKRAAELYQGQLWTARRDYAEYVESEYVGSLGERGCSYLILSARWGLIHPDTVIEPYDLLLSTMSDLQRASWALHVADEALTTCLPDEGTPSDLTLEIHAGASYVEALRPVLQAIGVVVEWPLQGLAIGQQLQWYKLNTKEA